MLFESVPAGLDSQVRWSFPERPVGGCALVMARVRVYNLHPPDALREPTCPTRPTKIFIVNDLNLACSVSAGYFYAAVTFVTPPCPLPHNGLISRPDYESTHASDCALFFGRSRDPSTSSALTSTDHLKHGLEIRG